MYLDLLSAHVISVAASILLFVLRGLLAILPANPRKHRGLEGAQRAADTVLFGTGVWLSVILRLDPLRVAWLGVVILCLIGYIVLGILVFRLRGPRWLRFLLFVAAVLLFAFIVTVAIWHDPRGAFVLLG